MSWGRQAALSRAQADKHKNASSRLHLFRFIDPLARVDELSETAGMSVASCVIDSAG